MLIIMMIYENTFKVTFSCCIPTLMLDHFRRPNPALREKKDVKIRNVFFILSYKLAFNRQTFLIALTDNRSV